MHYFFYKARWYIGIALLLCLAITVMKYSAWIDRKFFGAPRRPSGVAQHSAPAGSPQPVTGAPAAASGQLAALPTLPADVLLQLSQAKSLLEEASTNTSEALNEVLTWQSDVEPMRDQVLAESTATATGAENGGADEASKLFDRLAYVMRRDRTSAESLRDAASHIDSLQKKVEDLMKHSSPAALSPIDRADVSELHARCKQAKEDWRRDVEQALAIKHLLQMQTENPDTPAAPTTIGAKIKDADAKAAVDGLDKQIVREGKEEAARREHEKNLKLQKDLEEQKAAELLAQATSPEVKILLAPLLEPRTIQPSLSGTFSIKWLRTSEKKPMSLGKLIQIGVLEDSVPGRQKLALVAGNRDLPQPKWSIASQPNHWSSEDEERLKQAQQMLRDYGPLLVQAKWLSP